MADLPQIVSSTRESIGRYFSLVSAIPSAVIIAWTMLLVQSGAWGGTPDPAAALRGFTDLGLGGAAGLVLLSVVLGLVLHPVQFSLVQFLEGYWGVSRLARRMRFLRIRSHWLRLSKLRDELVRLNDQIVELDEQRRGTRGKEYDRLTMSIIELTSQHDEILRVTGTSPTTPTAVMPTRLGNVLRRYEWNVGKAYGIDAVSTIPYLSRVSDPGDMDYVNDQRSLVDLAVRMTVVCMLATALTVAFLARHGLWLLLAVLPYAAGYLCYRGAVVVAASYGRSLGVLVTLNRFALYDRLRLPPINDLDAERTRNKQLMTLLRHDSGAGISMTYRTEQPPATQT
jgi:hypothetical protein